MRKCHLFVAVHIYNELPILCTDNEYILGEILIYGENSIKWMCLVYSVELNDSGAKRTLCKNPHFSKPLGSQKQCCLEFQAVDLPELLKFIILHHKHVIMTY